MDIEHALLKKIRKRPYDLLTRAVYADWLEEQGHTQYLDFLRARDALAPLPPDHPERPERGHALSLLRDGLDPAWLDVIEPERAYLRDPAGPRPDCKCLTPRRDEDGAVLPSARMNLHTEPQDTTCDAWKRLLDLIERAAEDGRPGLEPRRDLALSADDWRRIVTLPRTIGKLKAVQSLQLYGSHLTRIPPEIGEMTSLANFVPYTSYRLHWLPYEITRCPNLKASTVSTRALYGNTKTGLPFPDLRRDPPSEKERRCSVCDAPFLDRGEFRAWISLRVATDVLPLLVNACSKACVDRLPTPPAGYPPGPHRGGIRPPIDPNGPLTRG